MRGSLFPVTLAQREEEALSILDRGLRLGPLRDAGTDLWRYQCERFYVGLTGGDDSLAAAVVASKHPAFRGCFMVHTGIGIREAQEFVRETCAHQSWPLHALHPPDRQYADLVLEYGFPGPCAHRFMYSWLKERALRKFISEQKTHRLENIGVVTGVRCSESKRRMGTVQEVQKDGSRIWIAPLLHWDSADCREYLALHNIPRSPVKQKLGMSGECLCGAFAQPGEFQRIAEHYPEAAAEIERLEALAAAAGVHSDWEEAPPTPPQLPNPRQGSLFDGLTLCSGCDWKQGWAQLRDATP